ncbi:hypothetical protein VNO77_34159 [Canavalia gladiata]|uniref:Uncharacterized protein n=1 Tax=Canavalia gladiata TaxID=3824 RepID=A0AAN9KG27_CANGL
MSWLLQHFVSIDDHMGSEEQLDRFTCVYMLRLIGGVWGLAILAYLYRELCSFIDYDKKEICRFSSLPQLWAWECFLALSLVISIRRSHRSFRDGFEGASSQSITTISISIGMSLIRWIDVRGVIDDLPDACRASFEIWTVVVPLIWEGAWGTAKFLPLKIEIRERRSGIQKRKRGRDFRVVLYSSGVAHLGLRRSFSEALISRCESENKELKQLDLVYREMQSCADIGNVNS